MPTKLADHPIELACSLAECACLRDRGRTFSGCPNFQDAEYEKIARQFRLSDCPDCEKAPSGICAECEHSQRIIDAEFKHG